MNSPCDEDGVVDRITHFFMNSYVVSPMTLREWAAHVASSNENAETLYSVIDGQGYHMHEEQLHTMVEWYIIAELSGIDRGWNGYR